MFKHLTNFGFNRSVKQAFGFYLAYLLFAAIICGLSGGVVSVIYANENNTFELGAKAGAVVAVMLMLILGYLILKQKNLLNNFIYIIFVLFSALIALFAGALGGLIPLTFLTTRKSKIIN